jgi:hypothetical protein
MPQSLQNDAKFISLFAFGLCFSAFTFYYLPDMRWFLHGKIHKATVTEADVNYV